MRDKERLKGMWEDFIYQGNLSTDLHKTVRESWLRSKYCKVNPFQEKGKVLLSKNQLAEICHKNKALIDVSLPLMNSLYSFVKGSGFLVILCDESGYLLKVIGDEDTLRYAQQIQFVEGADWSEPVMGTNAIGTSIEIDEATQIFAFEHFSTCCQTWTCSASPIHNTNGKIIGALNMSGPFEKVHSHTLGMVVSTVKAIENQLEIQEKTEKNELIKKFLEATTDALSEGMVITDQEGMIVKTNQMLQRIIKLKEEQLIGKKLEHIFQNKSCKQMLTTKMEVQDKELELKVSLNGLQTHVLLTSKPILQKDQMIGSLITIKEFHKVRQFVNHLSGNQAKMTFPEIMGNSPALLNAKKEALLAAHSTSIVLLTGESGTGKDVFAQAIHNESDRRHKPFIAINCGGIPRDLLGSELFGYVEGAFTGARKGGSPGKFELADGGTLFLDEIGEMSLEMQVHLLRVLQEKEIHRIGGHNVIPVDVRIIAATNKNLKEEVRKGSFREDLFFRLNVIPITLPPLRARKEDIPLLVTYFSEKLATRLHKEINHITPGFIKTLEEHSWPGNIRELQNVLERSIVRSNRSILDLDVLPDELKPAETLLINNELTKTEEIKKQALLQSIQLFNGNYSQAAKYLGISRSTLYRQMDRFHVRS